MMGCLFGAACLVGLVGMYKRRHCGGHRCGGHRCGGWGSRGFSRGRSCDHEGYGASYAHHRGFDDDSGFGRGGGGWLRELALRRAFERLRTTPAQEREIVAALDDLEKTVRGSKKDWRATKEQVADAMRGEDFNAEILGAVFSQHDDVLERIRKELVGTLARVHAVLDDRQRDELARLLERGGLGGRWA